MKAAPPLKLRIARPSLGVVLVRRRVDTGVLGDALRAGVRDIVEERDLKGISDAVARSHDLARSLREQVPGVGVTDEGRTTGLLAHQHQLLPQRRILRRQPLHGACQAGVLLRHLHTPRLKLRHLLLLALPRQLRVLTVALHAGLQGGGTGHKCCKHCGSCCVNQT